MISDEAVEAAAKAAYEFQHSALDGGWAWVPSFVREDYHRQARAVLEAAGPHMMRGVEA